MAAKVYVLCALTSLLCAALLVRAYLGNRSPLLFWSGLGFLALAASNVLLVVDLILLPNVDLQVYRELSALVGTLILIWGFLWHGR